MADDDIRQSPLTAIRQMRAKDLTKAPPAEAPEIELDENFWRNARIVESKAVAVLDCQQVWRRVVATVDEDKWAGPEPRPGAEAEERWIFNVLAEDSPDRHA